MPLTGAARAKRWREKQKRLNANAYHQREAARTARNFKPAEEMSVSQLATRRKRSADCMRTLRALRKQTQHDIEMQEQPVSEAHSLPCTPLGSGDTQIPDPYSSCSAQPKSDRSNRQTRRSLEMKDFDVNIETLSSEVERIPGCGDCSVSEFDTPVTRKHSKMPKIILRWQNSRKRVGKQVSNLRRRLADSEHETNIMKKRAWRAEKKLTRVQQSTKHKNAKSDSLLPTPVKVANRTLRNDGISPAKAPRARKALIMHNILTSAVNNLPNKERIKLLASQHFQRTRVAKALTKRLRINWRAIRVTDLKAKSEPTRRAMLIHLRRQKIQAFYKREDISTCLPGKRDVVRVGSERKQKYILNDYVGNAYNKYLSENPGLKISRTTFHRCRPDNVLEVRYNNRKVCLCIHHQNIALKLRVLNGLDLPKTPDAYIKTVNIDDLKKKLEDSLPDANVKFTMWKRVDVEYKGRTIKRTRLENEELSKEEFITVFLKDSTNFQAHASKVTAQYEAVRELKAKLPQNHVSVQMDFAENYTTAYQEEVQAAYYDRAQITLHPVVVHYMTNDNKLLHQTFMCVTDERSHTSSAVVTFMKEVVHEIKKLVPNLKQINYLTDSATSQYRNRTILHVVAQHEKYFDGVTASWTYFEVGHGKGPCDGAGGTAKRMADLAVKRDTPIRCAREFVDWGQREQSSMKYMLITCEQIAAVCHEFEQIEFKAIKGTMSLHAVMPVMPGVIATRSTSCFQDCCFSKEGVFKPTCPGWKEHEVVSNRKQNGCRIPMNVEAKTLPEQSSVEPAVSEIDLSLGHFVVAVYDGSWYPGKITADDNEDAEVEVDFMVATTTKVAGWKWPVQQDQLYIPKRDVLCNIAEPVASGKSKRVFNLSKDDQHNVESLMLQRQVHSS